MAKYCKKKAKQQKSVKNGQNGKIVQKNIQKGIVKKGGQIGIKV